MAVSENHLDGLLAETSETLDILNTLANSFRAVEAQTTSFQKQCEGLVREKQRVEGLANDIDYNLKFYSLLEPVTRRLNAPGAGSLVRSKEFSDMLARIDECLDYMSAHVSVLKYSMTSLTNCCSPNIKSLQRT